MNMKRASKKFVSLLTVLVLTIWGTIAFNIVESMSIEESLSFPIKVRSQSMTRDSSIFYTYKSDTRDPFHFSTPHTRDTVNKHLMKNLPSILPPFKLTGILTAGRKHTAMVEAQDGTVFFLQERDTISGMTILKIKDQAVTYFYQKKKNDWVLERP